MPLYTTNPPELANPNPKLKPKPKPNFNPNPNKFKNSDVLRTIITLARTHSSLDCRHPARTHSPPQAAATKNVIIMLYRDNQQRQQSQWKSQSGEKFYALYGLGVKGYAAYAFVAATGGNGLSGFTLGIPDRKLVEVVTHSKSLTHTPSHRTVCLLSNLDFDSIGLCSSDCILRRNASFAQWDL